MKTSYRYHWFMAAASVLLLCRAARAADYPTTVSSYNPLLYLRFDEPATSPPLNIVANSSTLGSVANGYAVNGVGKGQPGKVGNSIRLSNPGNPVGTCVTRVDVPWNPNFDPNPPFSIEFWTQPNSLGGDGTGFCIVSDIDPNDFGANRSGWLFYLNNAGRFEFRLGNTSGYTGITSATNGFASPGSWYHVVGTFDGTVTRLYVNGVLARALTVTTAVQRNSQSFLRMGGTPLTGTGALAPTISATSNNGNRGYDGWLDELAIYPAALSATQVKAHFDAATTNNAGYHAQILADSPNAYWEFEEPAVTPPDPSTFPIAVNSGTLGSAANGTNVWGTLANQAGSGYPGFGGTNKAVFMDGHNGYCQIMDAPGLRFSGNVTMMAWVKPIEQDYFRDIIEHGYDANAAETFLRISRGPGPTGVGDGNYYEVGSTDGINWYDSVLFPIPSGDIGNWVFLAGTFDGANWNLYRNGLLVGSVAASPGNIGAVNVAMPWTVGARGNGNPGQIESFSGYMDEPAVFNTTLADTDINTIYNSAQVLPHFTRAVQIPSGAYKNATVSFDVWAEGSPTLSYTWRSNGVAVGTATNLTLSTLQPGPLTVAAEVTNPYGSATSSVSFVVVASPPLIVTQPKPITRFVGFPFSFSVTAAGTTPISYQWQTNSINIPGATSSTYSNLVSAATAGNYRCVLNNEAGTSNSVTVALTALPIPPNFPSAVLGNVVPPIAYYRLGETSGTVAQDSVGGIDGTYFNPTLGQPGYSTIDPDKAVTFGGLNSYAGNISGTAINFTGHRNFTIECWVNAPAGQSDEATITAKGIGATGTTRTEQFSLDVVGGLYRFFTTGNNNALYEADASVGPNGTWQHLVAVYDDTNETGQGAGMYLYVNGQLSGSGTVRPAGLNNTTSFVSIGSKRTGNDPNYDGTFNGTIDEVAFYPNAMNATTVSNHYASAYGPSLPPGIALQPTSLTNYAGLPGSFSVNAYGTVPLSYQWKKGGSPISGATSSMYTIPSLALTDSGNYSVTIQNVNGVSNSVTVSLTVLSAPSSPPGIPGLVLHLPFDNNLTDASGRGNNGVSIHTTTNIASGGGTSNLVSATFVTDGVIGQAFHYQTEADTNSAGAGFGTNCFYAYLGVLGDLQFSSNVNFSVSYWIRLPANYIGGDLPFFTDVAGSLGGQGFVFAPAYGFGTVSPNPNPAPLNYGGWAASLYDSGAANGVRLYGDLGSINDGGWHHLVHVVTRTTSIVTYLDGVPAHYSKIAGNSVSAAVTIDPGTPACVGQDPTGRYGETGSGDIDDLGVWRKALTPLEAASIYIAGVSNHISFASAPITFTANKSGNTYTLSWNAGMLQQADIVTGPYTDVTQVSPLSVTISPSTSKKFYRVRGM